MKPPERFETPRLLLRPPTIADAENIFESYGQDSEVTRFLIWKPHANLEETQAFIQRSLAVWDAGSAFPWVLVLKQENRLVGMLELRVEGHKADLGYVLAKAYWGEGFATEAAQLIVDWALAQPEIFRVGAVCDVDNPASASVLEKVGMQREGILRRWLHRPNDGNRPRDCYTYAIIK